jgi:ParB family chromosome partitioning protein
MNARKLTKQPYQIKGVNALFGTDSEETSRPEDNVRYISLQDIELPTRQPRSYFDPDKQAKLVESIREHGILQPLIVRPSPKNNGRYELVIGERRYRGGRELSLETVPVIVRELNDERAWELSLLENLQREDLNPVEETEAILQLIESRLKIGFDEIAELLNSAANRDRKSVNNVIHSDRWKKLESIFTLVGRFTPNSFRVNRLPLLKLPDDILNTLRSGKIEYTKAKAIAKIKDGGRRAELLEEAIGEDLSLSQIKDRIEALALGKDEALSPTPAKVLNDTYGKLRKAQLWKKDPKKWRKAQTLLKKLEELLDDDASGDTSEPA